MLQILLIRPGATDFDEQRRIKGTLDIPLNAQGNDQVAQTCDELHSFDIDAVYTSPAQSAEQTAGVIGRRRSVKVKTLDKLTNLNHGLWHGKLIDEVKQRQPKLYRQFQEHPETVCPPEGETIEDAERRVVKVLKKLFRKHRSGVIALVVPEPLASVVKHLLDDSKLGNLWKAEIDSGNWEAIEIERGKSVQYV